MPQSPSSFPNKLDVYDEDELAQLWSIHSSLFGERDAADEDSAGFDLEPGADFASGGLHQAVLNAIAESDAEAAAAAPPVESAVGTAAEPLAPPGFDWGETY